jgi:hypothetical protein
MNLIDFDKAKYGIEGTGIDCHTKKQLTWSDKVTKEIVFTIPAGERIHIWFSPKMYPSKLFIQYTDEVKISRATNGHNCYTGLTKPPTIRTLQKRSFDGISKSIVNEKVESDGWGPSGAPSWELILGFI